MPDVLIICWGVDFNIVLPTETDMHPCSPAEQYQALSQLDGSYKIVQIPTTNPPTGGGVYTCGSATGDCAWDGNAAVLSLRQLNNEGFAATEAEYSALVDQLNTGLLTQAGLGVFAAQLNLNAGNIGLNGLISTGLQFVPLQ